MKVRTGPAGITETDDKGRFVPMALKRMDNVGIVVEDLAATIEFFRELGLA